MANEQVVDLGHTVRAPDVFARRNSGVRPRSIQWFDPFGVLIQMDTRVLHPKG